jgi:type 1 glutamine amidotransferase
MSLVPAGAAGLVPLAVMVAAFEAALAQPAADNTDRIRAASPSEAYAKPKGARKLLVFTLTRGFRHTSIPDGVRALEILGSKTGAYTAVHSEDIAVFEAESLRRFDAVCFLNTTGELFAPPDLDKRPPEQQQAARQREARLKKNLMDFVETGGGFVGIHAATDTFYQWPEYGQLIGGYFDGHPWHEEVLIHNEEREHPINAALEGANLVIVDEIYQFKEPYSRRQQRVLLSLDTSKVDMNKPGIHRTDGDFAVSWVREARRGRVFYCSLGHREEVYWNPKVLRLYLAGIQFALGDLEAEASPRPDGSRDREGAGGTEPRP